MVTPLTSQNYFGELIKIIYAQSLPQCLEHKKSAILVDALMTVIIIFIALNDRVTVDIEPVMVYNRWKTYS